MKSEAELASAAAEGDRAAFGELVARCTDRVYSHAYRMCGSREDAEDLTQEVFIKLWRSLPRFRGEAGFSTYLYSVCASVCIDFARRCRRRIIAASLFDEDGMIFDIPDSGSDPAERFIEAERRGEMAEALLSLSPRHRQILVMREIDGLSYEEISAALRLPMGTVRSRIARARLRLRAMLSELNDRPSVINSKGGDGE